MGGDRASPPPASSSPKHQCKVCDKIFPNGRSLGGHMRTLAGEAGGSSTAAKQRLKGSYLLRESSNKTLKSQPSHLIGDDKEMYWCGGAFHSSGGLTRHMRCHSDREPRSAPGLKGRRTNVESVTVPRTKSRSERTPPASNDGRDAAVNPVLLPEDVEESVSSNKNLVDLKTAAGHPDTRNDSKNVGSEPSDASFAGVAKENDHELLKKQEHEVPSTGGSNANRVSMKPGVDGSGSAVVRKRPLGADDDAKPDADHANHIVSSDTTLFKCIHCGKNFISYQALGGHRDRYRFAGCLLRNSLGTEKTTAKRPSSPTKLSAITLRNTNLEVALLQKTRLWMVMDIGSSHEEEGDQLS